MRRREFITLISGVAATLPLGARAQQPLAVVGFLHPASPDAFPQTVDGFQRGLNDAGFIEGQKSRSNTGGHAVNTIGFRGSPLTWFKGECGSFSRAVVKSQHWRRRQQPPQSPF